MVAAENFCLHHVEGLGRPHMGPWPLTYGVVRCFFWWCGGGGDGGGAAKYAFDSLEVPVGCVIVEDGKVISSGSNRTTATRNATRHAEMEAIDALLEEWQTAGLGPSEVAEKFSGCDLCVTCEPCIMCAAALSILGIREVYFGCANEKFGGCGSILSLHKGSSNDLSGSQASVPKGFKCTGGLMSEEAVALLRNFYEQGNPNAPKPHRPVRVPQQ